MNQTTIKPSVLCISAVDPMGMSGIHADLRALESMNVHGTSCITATTAQNQNGFQQLNSVSNEAFKSQLDALNDQDIFSVIKIGLLANADQVRLLLDHPIFQNKKVVLDPVLSATAGEIEAHESRLGAIQLLLPFVTVLTPNVGEAKQLLNSNELDSQALAIELLKLKASSVLIKGGHSAHPHEIFIPKERWLFIWNMMNTIITIHAVLAAPWPV